MRTGGVVCVVAENVAVVNGKRRLTAGGGFGKVQMTPSEYVFSILQGYPDNEMQMADLLQWQTTTSFDRVALYNALNYLHSQGKVVKHSEGKGTWWALAPAGTPKPEKPALPGKAHGSKPAEAKAVEATAVSSDVVSPTSMTMPDDTPTVESRRPPTMTIRSGRW